MSHFPYTGLRRERVLASPHFRAGRFRNPPGPDGSWVPPPSPPLSVARDFLFRRGRRVPPGPLPMARPLDAWGRAPSSGLRVTWLGHSTVLLELGGRRVLTDPVFGLRASPLGFLGPRRFHPTPVTVAELPPLDAVLLSHDHYDHLCRRTIAALAPTGVPVVTALGVGAHLERFGVDPARVTELDWHESVTLGPLRFTATPAWHFSGRGPRDRNRTLWASWVVESAGHRVFFSGDTGFSPGLADIGRRHGPFDLVMLEIGAFHPSWGSIHLGPANALEAHALLGGGPLLPIHWGTFNLALHAWDEPVETLLAGAADRGARILTPRLGAPAEPAHLDGPTPWWREVSPARARHRAPVVAG